MPPAIRPSLGATLLSALALAILPLACATGSGRPELAGTNGVGQSSSSGAGAGGAGGMSSSSTGGAGAGGATGAGGSGGAASATGTGGGAPTTCNNNPNGCSGCQTCVQANACATQWLACQNSIGGECMDLVSCLAACAGSGSCIQGCNTMYSDGVTPFDAYAGCMCPLCSTDCHGQSGC